jgi:hypothetical protein
MEIRPEMIILVVLVVAAITYFIMQQNQQTHQKPTCQTCPEQKTVYIREEGSQKKQEPRESQEPRYSHGSNDRNGPMRVDVDINDRQTMLPPSPSDQLRDFDHRVYFDKLAPPRHRNIHEPEYLDPALIPIYSRGPPRPYRKVGILYNSPGSNDPEPQHRILNLIGSKIQSGLFNYYAVPTRTDDNAKFELPGRGELSTGDTVTIAELGDVEYTVKLDQNALPLYAGIL